MYTKTRETSTKELSYIDFRYRCNRYGSSVPLARLGLRSFFGQKKSRKRSYQHASSMLLAPVQ